MAVEFKRLSIRRRYNGDLEGSLEVSGGYGDTCLTLTESQCTAIMSICADSLVKSANEIAEHMKSEVALLDLASNVAIENGADE